jgi:hypothetical protein
MPEDSQHMPMLQQKKPRNLFENLLSTLYFIEENISRSERAIQNAYLHISLYTKKGKQGRQTIKKSTMVSSCVVASSS